MLKVGIILKNHRLERGLSQEYLAHELGMSQSNYCKLESDHHFPSGEALDKLAVLYNITIQELVIGEGNNNIQNNLHHDLTNSINAHEVFDLQKFAEDLLASKDKIISLQAKQIEYLEEKIKNL